MTSAPAAKAERDAVSDDAKSIFPNTNVLLLFLALSLASTIAAFVYGDSHVAGPELNQVCYDSGRCFVPYPDGFAVWLIWIGGSIGFTLALFTILVVGLKNRNDPPITPRPTPLRSQEGRALQQDPDVTDVAYGNLMRAAEKMAEALTAVDVEIMKLVGSRKSS